jgi:uncharacterized protein (TIGR01732 family)
LKRLIAAIVVLAMSGAVASGQFGPPSNVQSFGDLRERVDGADGITGDQKTRIHEALDTADKEVTAIHEATQRIMAAATEGSVSATPEQKAQIRAKVREDLARIGASHQKLGALEKEYTAEIEASGELTPNQMTEVKAIVERLREKKIGLRQAIATLTGEGGALAAHTQGNAFVLIVVLFVLLVIVGAGFGCGPGC